VKIDQRIGRVRSALGVREPRVGVYARVHDAGNLIIWSRRHSTTGRRMSASLTGPMPVQNGEPISAMSAAIIRPVRVRVRDSTLPRSPGRRSGRLLHGDKHVISAVARSVRRDLVRCWKRPYDCGPGRSRRNLRVDGCGAAGRVAHENTPHRESFSSFADDA
jgi:hypothetical protein